jgi:zinc transporter 1/2/3
MDLKSFKFISILEVFAVSFISGSIPILMSCIGFHLNKKKQDKSERHGKQIYPQNWTSAKLLNDETENYEGSQKNSHNNSNFSVKKSNYANFSTYVSCFSGGIFLATGVLELFTDTVKNMSSLQNLLIVSGNRTEFHSNLTLHLMSRLSRFPLGEFFIAIGILLMILIEQLILTMENRRRERLKLKSATMIRYEKLRNSTYDIDDENNVDEVLCSLVEQTVDPNGKSSISDSSCGTFGNQKSSNSSNILLISLCLHSIFEGLSIGLQVNMDILVNVLTAISIHKCLMAFSLLQQLIDTRKSNDKHTHLLVYNALFAISNPIGVLIGIFLVNNSTTLLSSFLIGFVKAIASGTFIYITFFEILPHVLNNPNGTRLFKVFLVFLGFLLLSVVMFFMK